MSVSFTILDPFALLGLYPHFLYGELMKSFAMASRPSLPSCLAFLFIGNYVLLNVLNTVLHFCS